MMEYEYVEDIAGELNVAGGDLWRTIEHLGIMTQQTAVPPYGVEVSPAVSRQDAAQLRIHYAEKTG